MKVHFSVFILIFFSLKPKVITPPEEEKDRKLFFTTTWNSDLNRFEQLEEMKALTRKQYYQWLNHFQFTNELEESNFQQLRNLH